VGVRRDGVYNRQRHVFGRLRAEHALSWPPPVVPCLPRLRRASLIPGDLCLSAFARHCRPIWYTTHVLCRAAQKGVTLPRGICQSLVPVCFDTGISVCPWYFVAIRTEGRHWPCHAETSALGRNAKTTWRLFSCFFTIFAIACVFSSHPFDGTRDLVFFVARFGVVTTEYESFRLPKNYLSNRG